MKAAAEVLKEVRKSVATCSDEESKRTKFEKAKKQYPKIKGNKDVFCWTCHKSGNVATCSSCPRAFHLKCGHLESIPEPSKKWICPECDNVRRANSQTSTSQLKVLSQMLGYVIDRMKQVRGSEDFCEPVDTNKWHDYLDYVIKPMDIPKLADNVRRQMYKSTEDFLSDFRWLVHDSYVYNSVHSAYTKTAKSMSAVAKQECEEIKNCADCYLHAYSLGVNDWFIEPCTTPHILVWAQLSGFPYWPGKVMRHVNADMVDVRFFGDHSRANVPVTSCFLYSRLMPCAVKKNHPKIADGIEEAEQHVKRLRTLYGNFYYAQYRVRYVARDEDFIRKLQLPGFRKPGETPEFLKKVELERAEKMILDKDFQSEMKQMSTQSKKVLAPIKRKSLDKTHKEGAKRMLVQLNTPMGVKCAIMNCSGSESDSSPKHVSEKTIDSTKSRLFISSPFKTTPTKRIRLSDKFESLGKKTSQRTAPEKDAMIKQVVETSPKELADIYKSISPNKPKTPIKDSGIIESISRKLLTPTSLRSIRAANDSKEETPPRRTLGVEEQKLAISSSAKFRQNGLQNKFRGFSRECQEDSDGDSDVLIIASRESSPIRNIEGTSPRTETSPAKINSPPVVSSESVNSVLESGSAEKVEEKNEVKNGVLDSGFSAEKVAEESNDNVHGIEGKKCLPEEVKENGNSTVPESEVYSVSDSESFAGAVDQILPSDTAKKLEPSKSISCVTGESDFPLEKTDREKIRAVTECGDGKQLTENPDDICDLTKSTSLAIDGDFPPDKGDEKSDTAVMEIDRNFVLNDDSSAENVGGNSKVTECLTNTFTETTLRTNVKPGNDVSSVVDLEESNANDSERSVLDLLNGDLTQLYDNLASQCSSSDESAINDTANTTNLANQFSASKSELSVVSVTSSSSISSSVHSPTDISNETRPELGVLSILTSNTTSSCTPEDQICHTSKPKDAKDQGCSPGLCPNEIETDSSKEELSNTTETMVAPRDDCLQNLVKATPSTAVAKPDDDGDHSRSSKRPNEVQTNSSREEISNATETLVGREGDCLQDVEKPTSSTAIAKSDVVSEVEGRSPKHPNEVETDSGKKDISNMTETVVNREGDFLHDVEKPTSSSAIANSDVDSKDEGRSPKRPNDVVADSSKEDISDTTETIVNREGDFLHDVEEATSSSTIAKPDVPSSRPNECVSIDSVDELNRECAIEVTPSTNASSSFKTNQPTATQCLSDHSTVGLAESDEPQKTSKESSKVDEGLLPSSDSTVKDVELPVKPSTSFEKEPLDQKCIETSEPTPSSSIALESYPKSTDVSISISNGGNWKDLGPQASNSPVAEMVAAPVNEKDPVKSSRMKTTTIVFKHPSTSEKLLGEKSVKNVETLARQRSSLEDRGSDGLVKEKSSCPSMGREEELALKKPCESADKGKCKAINSTTNEADNNFLTITSTMSLRPLPQVDPSASTSARTQPITRTLKPSHLKDLAASAKRKIADASKTPVKKPRVKEVGKDAIASGMPRPIIIKVEPEDQVHEIKDSPPPLTSKAAAGPIKPSIKVVHLSNLMERPPPGVINRICPSPQNNMIPPFKPKKDMSDVRALIEAKKQFISAKLKADIYEMLDQIKAEYESHIDLLTSVSDRQLQNFESTFETDKIQLYEDFKNKLRDQMDQQITEIKRKQWCANCGAEASFHCCWNHAYCGDKCQKEDWSTHSQNCTQYSMSATDPYIRSSPRFRALLENQNASGAARKISLQDLIDVPVAVSVQNSPPKAQAKKPKKMLGSTPAYSGVPTISIPECELPELPRPPPSAKSFLTAPVQRLNNGEQISFDNGKRAYRIIQQNPGGPKTLKVVGQSTPTRNPTAINSYSGPVMRLGSQGRSFALVVGGDNNAKKPNQTVTYGALRKSIVTPPSSSGQQVNKTQTVTIAKRVGNQISVVKKTPSVRVMEDNELASILARNHLRDTYVHASS